MKNVVSFISKFLLALLGIGLASCGRVEYGCPYADFEARGVVSDEDGNKIQGIRVVVSGKYAPNAGNPQTDTLWTDHNGEYSSRYDEFAYMQSVSLEFEDVDGPENGGEFQKVEVEVPVFQVKEGDGNWYQGSYGAGADVTMIKK